MKKDGRDDKILCTKKSGSGCSTVSLFTAVTSSVRTIMTLSNLAVEEQEEFIVKDLQGDI